jgi:hypothetical protein
VTAVDLQRFEQIWCVDFEFISKPGEHPDVLCLCALELHTGQSLRLWEDQLGAAPPYRIDDGAVFVCFSAIAECACHRSLGWPLPKHVIDLSPMLAYPKLESLRQLRHTRSKMRWIKLAVGADGRNRTVLWTHVSKTGRSQPKASKWIFSPAVWLRFLIKPEPGRAIAYID